MSARSVRPLFEAALFLVALGLGVAAFDLVDDTVADALYFGAWCAAMLLIFSLALRLPLHLRGRLARLANLGRLALPSAWHSLQTSPSIGTTRISTPPSAGASPRRRSWRRSPGACRTMSS
jgi:hypothetical protein